jgi:antitoxin MazE
LFVVKKHIGRRITFSVCLYVIGGESFLSPLFWFDNIVYYVANKERNMVLNVVSVSDGKGIRFPASIINAFGIKDKIILKTRKNDIVITPLKQNAPRKNWDKAFKKMNADGDDNICFEDNDVDFEWEWQ